eukprot:366256-Chlamydomonas_euryale.AAC.17
MAGWGHEYVCVGGGEWRQRETPEIMVACGRGEQVQYSATAALHLLSNTTQRLFPCCKSYSRHRGDERTGAASSTGVYAACAHKAHEWDSSARVCAWHRGLVAD